jgi:hypothetical protein
MATMKIYSTNSVNMKLKIRQRTSSHVEKLMLLSRLGQWVVSVCGESPFAFSTPQL